MNLATVGTGKTVHLYVSDNISGQHFENTACNSVRGKRSTMDTHEGELAEVTCKRCMRSEAYAEAEAAAAPATEATQAELPGYTCKTCGGVAPVGIGYVDNTMATASLADSLQVTVCPCGASQAAEAAPTAVDKIRATEAATARPADHSRVNRRTAEAYLAAAKGHHESLIESFERCDTDGFMSQWADQQLEHSMHRLAELAANGWQWATPALFDLQGNLVPAVYRQGDYGWYWGILDPANPRGKFLGFFTESSATNPATARAESLIEYWQPGARIVDNGQPA